MSYRAFKRVLGETSLERKCRFLFGACLLVLISGSFFWYGQQTEKLVTQQDRTKGSLLVDTIMIAKHWHIWVTDYPEKLIEFQGANLQGQQYTWKFLKANSTDLPKEPIEPYEQEILDEFLASPPTDDLPPDDPRRYREVPMPGLKRYEYFQPIYATAMKEKCINCHKTSNYQPDLAVGDLMAVVKVTISTEATQREQITNRAILIATAIVTVALAMAASYAIVKYIIVKPLKHLRDVSDAVSRGKFEQRADIHTADEFEQLGDAFNRMLRHLVTTQDELRQANSNLDGKVDQLAQANMQLFEMNRLKSDFLATMSHELRTPLNSIIGFSDVLGSINSLDDKQKRYVGNIQKSGKMLLDMINDILDLAKIESGKMEVRPIDLRVEHVIGAQCDMARPLTERKNIDLEIDIEPHLPELHQDQGKVQQILNNLLSNAIKFTPEGGRIVISARRSPDGDLLLTVTDTGVGIAEADQVQIFEKFRQGNTVLPSGDAMTREYSGTGLGLSIVKELCKLLGGEIALQSELGRGSTFTVRLPWILTDQPRLVAPQPEAPTEELAKVGGRD